jgi:hypothetical protein
MQSYSLLNAVGYRAAVGRQPRLARASTIEEVDRLCRCADAQNMARRSRLFKAVQHLRDKGYVPKHDKSTIREVVMETAEGKKAVATSKGEVIVNDNVVERFLNG